MIQSGDLVTISGGAMQPVAFLAAISARRELRRVTLTTSMSLVPPDFLVRQFVASSRGETPERNVKMCTFSVGPGDRQGAAAGVVDVVPIGIQTISSLLHEKRMDVIVVGCSGMDDDGNFNLGCNVDWMPDLLAAAEESEILVIAEVNRSLPWTEGETTFRIESVDHIVEAQRPPIGVPLGANMPEAQAIGGYLSSLIQNESTLQVGLGDLVAQSISHLAGKRDMGVYSDLIGDALYRLLDRGVLTGRCKGFMNGKWVGTFILGGQKLYEFVNHNPVISLHPSEFVIRQANIVRNHRMVSVTQGSLVDLTGQVAGQTLEYEFLSNPGAQRLFHISAAISADGMGIVVLPSASSGGRETRVVSTLPPGTPVAIPNADVDRIVTEYGVARLRGKSLGERALNMISIAHPAHRDRLAHEARTMGLL
jgi:acyl-CoA hydrolase